MKKYTSLRKMILAALFLALSYIMPFLTGQVPEIGSMLCPLHIPVLLCGFICGPVWGLTVGFTAPLLRSLTLTVPPLFPKAVSMAFELAAYGLVAGVMHKTLPRKKPFIYASLLTAMTVGRTVWGAAMYICTGISGDSFTFAAFIAGAFTNAIPGIIIQIILIPVLVMLFDKSGAKGDKSEKTPLTQHQTEAPFSLFLKELEKLKPEGRIIVALDGGSASGKTTLCSEIERVRPCTVFHMDDFFLQPFQRTPQRLSEVGGNVDRERFLKQVLEPLRRGEDVIYRKFDCSTMSLSEEVHISPKELVIVEGVYSMHPDLEGFYDFRVFLDIAPDLQRERISKRNSPQTAQRFFDEWIPLENTYFEKTDIKQRCNVIISVK